MAHAIDTEIDVQAFYFAGKDIKGYPRRISLGDRAVTFADGIRVKVDQGGQLTYLYNMLAEGGALYRLRQVGNQWTLVGAR